MRKYESVVSIPTQALPCSGQRVSSQPAPTGAAPLGLQFANRVQRYNFFVIHDASHARFFSESFLFDSFLQIRRVHFHVPNICSYPKV